MAWYYWILVGYFFIGIVLGLASNIKSRDWDWVHFLFCLFWWLPTLLQLGFCKLAERIEGGGR